VDVRQLSGLLEEGRYAECRARAEALLHETALSDGDRARSFLALSYATTALHAGQEALGSAELAVHFSRASAEYDVTGHALCHLAFLSYENRLYKRAVQCLDEYFRYFDLYGEARKLEGWVLAHMGQYFHAMGRAPKALEYLDKAYRWHLEREALPAQVDQHRAEWLWHLLKAGRVEQARDLLAASNTYLCAYPNDIDARARYLNNRAYFHYLGGNHRAALEVALQALQVRGVSAARKAQACLTLHYAARAMHCWKEARGLATLARIHANVSRRPELEEEATRVLLHLQTDSGLPLMDELFRNLDRMASPTVSAVE
jgi:tetratricopeptide (TPR) repeat protein